MAKKSKWFPLKNKKVKQAKPIAKPRKGERVTQGVLIDVQPANHKEIAKVAVEYRDALQERLSVLATEKNRKARLLALIKDAKLQPLDNGKIKFPVDGLVITVTPRDELVRVKDAGDDSDSDGDKDSEEVAEGKGDVA